MTLVEHNHEQQQSARPAANRVDLARTDADRVSTLVQIARDGHTEARDHGEDADRLQQAFSALYDRIASKVGDRRTRLDRALHGIDGSLDEHAVLEYLDLVGREGMASRQALQQILDGRMFPEFDGGQDISDRLHGLAHTWEREDRPREAPATARPALPPAASVPAPPVPLQRREPIRPAQEPMFPPAPPETPVQRTGTIASRAVAALREAGKDVTASEAALEASYGHGAPSFGPAPDPQFSPSSLPQVRSGDTQRFPAVQPDRELTADGPAAKADFEEGPEPRPFVTAASTAANDSSPSGSASGSGKDDD